MTTWATCTGSSSSKYRCSSTGKADTTQRASLSRLRPTANHSLVLPLLCCARSGDVDQCVPYYYSDIWVREMGYPVKFGQEWRAWTYGGSDNSVVGGYVTEYDEPNGLTFLTVKDGQRSTQHSTHSPTIPHSLARIRAWSGV